ncbi:MAG: phosphatidylcholine synthase [Candidatus Tokpelaia sp. JSC188]|nr:MAG: phosphatidylcholine synthase [Candidatus Tokpelaia sp. JSC188]
MKQKLAGQIRDKARYLKSRKVFLPQVYAFSVHLLTASGSFFAFLSLIAASEKQWAVMWSWLGMALIIDAVDGPIARRIDVKYVLPTWSGETLDNIVDYVTYVLIPAFAIYQSGLIGPVLSFLSAALIMVSSAIYYADTDMKSEENFFKGFPVVWNILIFTVFMVHPLEWVAFVVVFISAILSFMPVYFVHPIRVRRLRSLTISIVFIWALLSLMIVFYYHMKAPYPIRIGLVASSLYIYFIGAFLQLFPNIGRRAAFSNSTSY